MITLDLSEAIAGCERIQRRLAAIAHVMDHAGPLLEHWERLVEEGNRRGVLAGLDKDGNPMLAVTYRPRPGPKGKKLTVAQRLGQHPRKRRGDFYGIGSQMSGINNNLTSSEYRQLDGPPLAPRRQFSRVITNFATSSWQLEEHGSWVLVGTWGEVVNAKGYYFLRHLFRGDPPQPGPRDLRGVRPDDLVKIKATILPWAKLTVRELWNGTE